MELLKSFLPKARPLVPQTPIPPDLTAEATRAVWDEIKTFTLLDFREKLSQLNINTRGRLAKLVERYNLFKKCPYILEFDIELLEIAIRLVEEKNLARASLAEKLIQDLGLSGNEEQALIQSITLLNELNLNGEGEGYLVNLQRLLNTIRDVRNEHLQRSNADIRLENICSEELGYTRKQVLTEKDLVKLGEKTLARLGAWRDEYAENEEHLRENLILLLEDVIKLKKFQKKMQPPEFLKEVGITQPVSSMEEILNALDHLSPQNVMEAWARLNPNEKLTEWALLEALDANLQQLHALANLWVKKSQKSQLKIKDLAATLPTVPKQNNGDWHAYIHDQPADVIVCKEIKGSHVLLREIGVRCDGLLIRDDNVLKQYDDWSFHTSERTLGLSWSAAAGLESGITLDDLINNQSILNIATIQFNFEGETYIIDIRKWGVISKHSSIKHKTLSNISPVKVEQTLADGKRVVFLRFVMQIIDLSDKAMKYLDLMLKNSFNIQESGAVLVHAFETSIANSIKSVQANYTTLFMISNSLRSSVFSNLNELLRKQLRSSLEMEDLGYDLPLKSETKEILYKLTLAGPEDKHSAVVSLRHIDYANVLVSKCHFLTKSLMVEQSNLQAVLRKLDKYNGYSNLVFCTLIISGKLSPLDIARIVEKIQRSAIRLLIVNYSQLVYSLQITGAMAMVEVPPSLFPDSQHVMLQPYADNIFSSLYSSDVVVPANVELDLQDVRTAVTAQINWTQEEMKWRHKKIENVSTDTFSLICSSDPNIINAYYNDVTEVKLFNCRAHTWKDLKAKVDLLLTLEFEEADVNPCICLLNAHLLSDLHKTYIISKSVLAKHKIILAMPHFNSFEQFQSVSDNGKLIEVEAKVIFALPSEALLKKTANRDIPEYELSKYRCAKLLGGQMLKSDFLPYILNSKQVAAEYFVKALSSEQSISKNVLEEVAAILFLHHPQAKFKPSYKEFPTLHQYVAAVSLSSIYATTFEEDITFENFVKFTPLCQFISQTCRIILYLREVLKIPEAEQVVDYFAKKGSFSNVHTPHMLGYMASPKDSANAVEIPQYSIVQHDSSVDFAELVSQQCIQGHELDWNRLASTWKVFPYSADFLMALLATYPYKLKLLCTLSFSTILHTIENGGTKWADVLLEISRITEQVDGLLTIFAPIASYVSVLKWGMILNGMAAHLNFDERDIKVLIENRIPLSILNGMEGRIIPIILSLDGPPDVIYQQIQLREYFLNMSLKNLTDVAHRKPTLGLAFLDFIFHPLIRDSEEAKGCSVLQLDEAKLLLGWLRHTKLNIAGLRGRLTEAALANLVCRATSNDQIELLWSILQFNDCSNIIKIAIGQQHSQQQVLRLLELICKAKGKGALKMSATTDVEKFYGYLYLALSENQFDLLMESVANFNGVKLPIALSERLLELYIQYFSDHELGFPNFNEKKLQQAIRIAVLAISESGSNAVLEKLKLNCDGYKGIGMIHWLMCPYQPLPFTLTTEDAQLMRNLSKREVLNFTDRVQKNLAVASNYALYLEAPYYLSLPVVNFYRKLEGEAQIGEVSFIVAQKGEISTPYCITVPEMSLPKEYLNTIKSMTFNIPDEEDSISALKFIDVLDLTSGVNIEKMETNLSALCLLDRVEFDEQKNLTIGKEEVTATQVYIANCIFAWFWACGIPSRSVEELLSKSVAKMPVYFDKLKTYSDLTRATLFPLPSVLNCTLLRDITGLPLFGTSREASLFTYQIFNTAVERFNADFPAPYTLLRSTSKTLEEFERTAEYDKIHHTTARIVAKQLANEIASLGSSVNFNTLEAIGRGLYQMIHSVNNPDYPWHHSIERRDVVSQMMQLILEDTFKALSTTKGEWQAVLSRILIGQVGFSGNTRDTFTQVVSIIIKFYTEKNAAVCKQTYQELSFIIANGFVSPGTISKQPTLVHLQRDFGGVVDLTYKSISTRDVTKSTCQYLPPYRQQSADTEVETLTRNEKREVVLFKTPEHSSHVATTGIAAKSGFIESASISQSSDIHVFSDTHHIVIYCHDLLEFQPNSAGFASIIVRAGLETCLIRHPHDSSTFLVTKRDAFTTPQGEFGAFADGEICSIFASNGVAWEFIDKQTPSGTVLATSSIFLKKSNDSLSWIPMILSTQPISRTFDDIMQTVFFWKLVDRFELLNYSLPSTLVEFLLFLCKVVCTLLGNDTDQHLSDPREILSYLAMTEINDPVQLLEIASRLDIIKTIISTALKTKRPLQIIIAEVLRAEEQQDYFPDGFEQELCNLLMKNSAPKMLAHIEKILERRILPKIFFASSIATSEQLINGTHTIASTLMSDIKTVTEDVSAQIFDGEQNGDEHENEPPNELNKSSDKNNVHCPFGENTQRNVGYGTATSALQQVISLFDDNPNLYFTFLDPVIHKMNYDAVKGMPIGYILSGNLYNNTGYPNNSYTKWLVDVLRSPLSELLKRWFLQMCCIPMGKECPLEDHLRGSTIISYCLAEYCPVPLLRERLLGATSLHKGIESFCQRKNGKYGIYFCNSHTLHVLQEKRFNVEIVDLGATAMSKDASSDEIYLQIIGSFKAWTTIVYVQGLALIEDIILKWCCEYTERCPWRFIYFENTNSSFNFAENRDRCNYLFYERPSLNEMCNKGTEIGVQEINFHSRQTVSLEDAVAHHGKELQETEMNVEWISALRTAFDKYKTFVFFIFGPPGAGKTFMLERIINEKQGELHAVRIDCSNDDLLEVSMEDVLQQKFPKQKKSLLVADEFHMLLKEQKKAMFKWVSERLSWVKVVAIGNRSVEHDFEIANALKLSTDKDVVHIFNVRLNIDQIGQIHSQRSKDVINFLKLWNICSRALFGEESISLRNLEKLAHIYETQGYSAEHSLANFLLDKIPMLGSYSCWQFTHFVLDLAAKKGPEPSSNMPPFQLLVFAASLDKTAKICSYPEFVRLTKQSHEFHPIVRLATWVSMAFKKAGLKQPHLDSLRQLHIIDQVGFPLILSTSSRSYPLSSVKGFAKYGDFNNLAWMADAIQHGYAMDWNQAKKAWGEQYITSFVDFSHLLSVCPDPVVCLTAIHPKNLSLLIESSRSAEFCKMILKWYPTNRIEGDMFHSPVNTAAWLLLRNQPAPYDSRLIQTINKDLSQLKVLIWASKAGIFNLTVNDDIEGRTNFIRSLLIAETSALFEGKKCLYGSVNIQDQHIKHLIDLWSNLFAPLLEVGLINGGIPYEAALTLAATQYPANSRWPDLIHRLGKIIYRQGGLEDAEALLDHNIFARIEERYAHDPNHAVKIPNILVPGLLSIKNLHKKWQITLLETEGVHIPNEFCTTEGLSNLQLGIAQMRNVASLRISHGTVRKKIEEIIKLRDDTRITKFTYDIEHQKQIRRMNGMKYLKQHNVKNPNILRYYNQYAGAKISELKKGVQFELDQYKNPKGSEFDLGRQGAFGEFRILVGNFYSDSPEFNKRKFDMYAKKAMETKGFSLDYVETEEAFMTKLDILVYDQAWIISSHAADWHKRMNKDAHLKQWQQLANVCEKFWKQGGGLFILGENEPFFDHANVVLERITDASDFLQGNEPGGSVLDISKFQHEHLLLSGLDYIFEGITICHAPKPASLSVLIRASTNNPIIMYKDMDQVKAGRIVVDCGYTKMWMNWEHAGTERYFCNVAVWLLGLDFRLDNKLPIRGPINSSPTLRFDKTPTRAPKEFQSPADVLLVIDGSGSVGAADFEKMRHFSEQLIGNLGVDQKGIHFGVIQFTSTAHIISKLSYNLDGLVNSLRSMPYYCGGTCFDVAFQLAEQELLKGRPDAKKIIIFQTDGDDYSSKYAPTVLSKGITIFVIGVGPSMSIANRSLQVLTCPPYDKHIFAVSDYSKIADIKNSLMAAVKTL